MIQNNSNDKFGSSNVRITTCGNLIKLSEASTIEYKLDGCSGENAEIGNAFRFKVNDNKSETEKGAKK